MDGLKPSRTDVRDGLQTGAWQWALVNKVPLAANLSRLGVLTCGWPPRQPIQSFRSSMARNRTLGFVEALANEPRITKRVKIKDVFPIALSELAFDVKGAEVEYLQATVTFAYSTYEFTE